MPRIDPERLLKCLQPLLEPTSGAIKSCDEVDKILGLMSKFSKKLVSKCIYLNILKTSDPTVLDLFMQRGGWGLVYGWANEGTTTNNYPLLKQIISLLLQTPTTIPRLKENKFPVLIKTLSKDCEDEEIRNLAKQVVAKWISVAKGEESFKPDTHLPRVEIPAQVENIRVPIEHNQNIVPELGSLNMNADSLLNIEPSIMPDAENQLMDFDISHTDLADIDFNLDILSKIGDQQHHLEDTVPEVAPVVEQLTPKLDHNTHTVLVANPNHVSSSLPISSVQQPPKDEVIEMLQVQSTPKIFIKTVGGQRTVVQSLSSLNTNTSDGHYCVVIKDGKNYLMRLKTEPKTVTSLVVQEPLTALPIKNESKPLDAVDNNKADKRKSPRKDPSISPVNKLTGETSLRTYGAKNKSSVSKESVVANKKPTDQIIKPVDKSDTKDKDKKVPREKERSGLGEIQKKSKSSSSSSKAAAAAVAKQLEEEKLREEIRKQKALMKKRQKDAVKQKQQEKDQETLKKLNLTPPSASPSSAMKIPKIPKKTASFADAIGIPGSGGVSTVDKIKKVSPDKSEKTSSKQEETPPPPSPTKKFYGKKEEEVAEADKPKERRHRVKVFVSSKSRADDLLKEMTETGKPKVQKEKEKEKEKEEVKPSSVTLGNSIPAVPPPVKPSKRLSTDTVEKPGDSKKAKLSETKVEKSKDIKDSSSNSKEKEKKKAIALKESTLFMDMLNASTDNPKPAKRKRRPSTGSEKEKNELTSPVEKSPKILEVESPVAPHDVGPADEPAKPVFNFYRDTLNDSDEDKDIKELVVKNQEASSKDNVELITEPEEESFTPHENDGQLKSALCLVRPRNKPKKSVRWREEEELKEFHYFEMDETERVNVTKQKDFTELSQNEKAIEKSRLRHRFSEEEEEEKNDWRLRKTIYIREVMQPPVTSQEKYIQEEREKNVLGLFLPPGAPLPDAPIEPDTIMPMDRTDPKLIPVEDVMTVTKVCDYRTHTWPTPKALLGYSAGPPVPEMQKINQNPVINAFHPPADFNPWNANLGFSVPPVPVPNMGDMSTFQQFPPPNPMSMNMIGSAPPPAMGFPNPFAFPPPMVPSVNGPPQSIIDPFAGNQNRDTRVNNANRGRFNDSEQRRNYHGRDRDNGRDRGNSRDRDHRDDRGARERDRDRDHRRRDRDNSDRDYGRHYDRDRNNRDFRSGGGRSIRKDIPCRYFKKGFCQNGSRCEFMHDLSNSHDDSRNNSRQDSHDSGRPHRSPDSNKDVDLRQSPEMSPTLDSWSSGRPNISETDATRFALPPSSPTEPEVPGLSTPSESTKVIPV